MITRDEFVDTLDDCARAKLADGYTWPRPATVPPYGESRVKLLAAYDALATRVTELEARLTDAQTCRASLVSAIGDAVNVLRENGLVRTAENLYFELHGVAADWSVRT